MIMSRGPISLVMAVLIAGCGRFGRQLSPIRLEAIVTLGEAKGEGAIATTPVVSARHPGGFRIVTPTISAIQTSPLAFTDDGRYLESLRGDTTALGKFSGPMFVRLGPGDSIWVFDNSGRVLIFNAQRRFVRTITLPTAPIDAFLLQDNRIVASFDASAAVQLLDANGALVRIVAATPIESQGVTGSARIVPAPDGSFWTYRAQPSDRLEHWDTSGTKLGEMTPQADGFLQQRRSRLDYQQRYDRPPAPSLVPRWIDGKGRLWVLGDVADRHWESGLTPRVAGDSASNSIGDFDRYFDTVLEVRDLRTGALLAMTRLDNHYTMAEPGVLVHVIHTNAGWQRAELMRVVYNETSRP